MSNLTLLLYNFCNNPCRNTNFVLNQSWDILPSINATLLIHSIRLLQKSSFNGENYKNNVPFSNLLRHIFSYISKSIKDRTFTFAPETAQTSLPYVTIAIETPFLRVLFTYIFFLTYTLKLRLAAGT